MIEISEDRNYSVNFVREGVKVGLINSAIVLGLLFGSYYISFKTFVDTQLYAGFIPYMFLLLILFGLQLRRRNNGFLAFKECLQYAMIAYLIPTVLFAIANFILFNVIDHSLSERTFQAGIEKTRAMMLRMGAPEKDIQETLGKVSKQKNDTSIKNIFLGMGGDLIFSFMKSMLIAILIRREKPQPITN